MYKIYLAGLSGQSVQFTSLTEAEAAAFALGASDKANIHSPKSRRQLEEAVTQLVNGEWATALASVQERLNRIQAERDELRSCCDKLAAEVRQQVEGLGKLRVERDHLLVALVAA